MQVTDGIKASMKSDSELRQLFTKLEITNNVKCIDIVLDHIKELPDHTPDEFAILSLKTMLCVACVCQGYCMKHIKEYFTIDDSNFAEDYYMRSPGIVYDTTVDEIVFKVYFDEVLPDDRGNIKRYTFMVYCPWFSFCDNPKLMRDFIDRPLTEHLRTISVCGALIYNGRVPAYKLDAKNVRNVAVSYIDLPNLPRAMNDIFGIHTSK